MNEQLNKFKLLAYYTLSSLCLFWLAESVRWIFEISACDVITADYKQLLDEAFVISRIIEVEVGVISRSRGLRLITETSIILDITKSESNNCFIIHWTKTKLKSCFCFFTDGKQHKARELDMITLRNHAPRSYMTCYSWPWVSLTRLLYNLQLWRHRHWFRKCTVRFRPIKKELESSMYNNTETMSRTLEVMG